MSKCSRPPRTRAPSRPPASCPMCGETRRSTAPTSGGASSLCTPTWSGTASASLAQRLWRRKSIIPTATRWRRARSPLCCGTPTVGAPTPRLRCLTRRLRGRTMWRTSLPARRAKRRTWTSIGLPAEELTTTALPPLAVRLLLVLLMGPLLYWAPAPTKAPRLFSSQAQAPRASSPRRTLPMQRPRHRRSQPQPRPPTLRHPPNPQQWRAQQQQQQQPRRRAPLSTLP